MTLSAPLDMRLLLPLDQAGLNDSFGLTRAAPGLRQEYEPHTPCVTNLSSKVDSQTKIVLDVCLTVHLLLNYG